MYLLFLTTVYIYRRTETIAGRNYQNVGAPNGTCMQVNAQKHTFNDSNSLFQVFHNNGYLTAMFGKLTNDMTQYFCQDKPPKVQGFDRIQAPCDYNDFYGLQLRLIYDVFLFPPPQLSVRVCYVKIKRL